MAAHADFCAWNACEGRSLDRLVAISTVQPDVTDMMFVTEWNRLITSHLLICDVRRTNHRGCDANSENWHEDESENDDP